MNDISKRISRIERENRILKVSVVLVGVAFVAGAAKDADHAKTIRAEQFVLVDGQGKPRADWRIDGDGGAHFAMRNKDGDAQLGLVSHADGSAELLLRSGNKANSAELLMTFKDNIGTVRLFNRESKRSLSLNFSDSGSMIAIVDKNQKESMIISVTDNTSSFSLSDGNTKRLQALLLRPQDKSGFLIIDEKDNVIWRAP